MGSIGNAQEDVLEYLRGKLVQPVFEISIPDATTVRRVNGEIEPYVAVQFGDLQMGRTTNMATTVGDDYTLPLYTESVAPTAEVARKLGTLVTEIMLGYSPPHCGQFRKRMGGMIFPLTASNAAVEAYMMPASFAAPIQVIV